MTVYRHKTVSVPQEAHYSIKKLRELASRSEGLPAEMQKFLDANMDENGQKYTHGIVLWMAAEFAIAAIEKHRSE